MIHLIRISRHLRPSSGSAPWLTEQRCTRFIGENLEAVGDLSTAWTHKRDALVSVAMLQKAQRREAILASAAKTARRANLLHAAISLQSEVIADAQQIRACCGVVQGSLDRAEVHGLLGEEQRAAEDIAQAQQWLTRVPDKALETDFVRKPCWRRARRCFERRQHKRSPRCARASITFSRAAWRCACPVSTSPSGVHKCLPVRSAAPSRPFWRVSERSKPSAPGSPRDNCVSDISNSHGTCSRRW